MMPRITLGVDLSFAKKRWPEPDAWLEIVSRDLGLDCVEFDSDFLDPFFVSEPGRSEIASEIRGLAAEAGIQIHNYFTGAMTHCVNLVSHPDERIRRDGVRWCEDAIRLASQLGARGIGGHFDTISSRNIADPKKYQGHIHQLIGTMQYLSECAAREGHEFILIEQMYAPSEVPYTLEQTEQFFGQVNESASVPIRLTIDVGHMCCRNFAHAPEDIDPYAWIRRFGSITPVIHLQQTHAEGSCHWPFTNTYNRQGIIDGHRIIESLHLGGGQEVALILEIFFSLGQTDQQVIDDMRQSVDYWKRCIDAA